MKKIVTLLAVLLASATVSFAQIGVVGGFTSSYSGLDGKDLSNLKNVSLFHAGVAYKVKLGPLFALQPALTYQVKGANVDAKGLLTTSNLNIKSQFVELSLGAQLGVDLLMFRPFILLEPFIGYEVATSPMFSVEGVSSDDVKTFLQDNKNRLDIGFGVGGGIELLNHVQLSVQWFMNAGSMFKDGTFNASLVDNLVANAGNFQNLKNYHGVKVTLGIFF